MTVIVRADDENQGGRARRASSDTGQRDGRRRNQWIARAGGPIDAIRFAVTRSQYVNGPSQTTVEIV